MVKQKSVPCYVANGGLHNVINVPFGIFTRLRLHRLVKNCLKSWQHFETMIVIEPEEADIKLLQGLDAFLSLNLKPKSTRSEAVKLLSANEENLKPSRRMIAEEKDFNVVTFAISTGLIVIMFLIGAHIESFS